MEAKEISGRRPSQLAQAGMAVWVVGFIWFFLAQLIVGSQWSHPGYSWSANNVSDLGNVRCQMWAEDGHAAQYVCSPLHSLMNATFVLEGLAIIFGLWTVGFIWKKTKGALTTRILLSLSATGIIVAGLAPADIHQNIHVVLGAFFIVLFGTIGLLCAGKTLDRNSVGRLWPLAPVLGVVGIIGGYLFFSHHYLGLGPGGMERCWGYVVTIWTFIVGLVGLYKSKTKTT